MTFAISGNKIKMSEGAMEIGCKMNTALNNRSCKFPNKNVIHLNLQLLRLRLYIFVKCVKNVKSRPQWYGIWERERNIDRVWTMRTTKRENWKKNFSHVSCIAISTVLCSLSHAMTMIMMMVVEESLKDSFSNIYKYFWILFFKRFACIVTTVVYEKTANCKLRAAECD